MIATLISSKSITPEMVGAALGAIIPVLTALSTHVAAAAKVKAGITLVLGIIAGPVATFLSSNAAIVSWASAKSSAVAWVVALATYLGAWKPVVDLNAKAAPAIGLGRPVIDTTLHKEG